MSLNILQRVQKLRFGVKEAWKQARFFFSSQLALGSEAPLTTAVQLFVYTRCLRILCICSIRPLGLMRAIVSSEQCLHPALAGHSACPQMAPGHLFLPGPLLPAPLCSSYPCSWVACCSGA